MMTQALAIVFLLFGSPAERTWKAKCAACHGDDGKAQTDQGKKMGMKDLTTAKDLTDDKIKNAILNGIKEEKDGKKKEMDAFKDKLRPDQVDALIPFVKALVK